MYMYITKTTTSYPLLGSGGGPLKLLSGTLEAMEPELPTLYFSNEDWLEERGIGSMGRSSILLAAPPLGHAFVTEEFMTFARALDESSDSELWPRPRYLLGELLPQSRELAVIK